MAIIEKDANVLRVAANAAHNAFPTVALVFSELHALPSFKALAVGSFDVGVCHHRPPASVDGALRAALPAIEINKSLKRTGVAARSDLGN